MKVSDILVESISFDVSEIKHVDGMGDVASALGSEQDVECFVCNGTGKDEWPGDDKEYPCGRCDGKGTYKEFVEEGPTLNLANAGAFELLRALGYEADYSGRITDLPDLKRRIMRLLNSEKTQQQMVQQPTDNDKERPMGINKNDDGSTSIGRQGARMVGGGRTSEQVKQIAQRMLDMVQWAQKTNPKYHIGWG